MRLLARVAWWGLLIYAIMYLVWSATVIYGASAGYFSLLVRCVILFALVAAGSRALRITNWRDAIAVSGGWALVAIICDALLQVPFAGWSLYSSWSVWMGYALIVIFTTVYVAWRARSSVRTG